MLTKREEEIWGSLLRWRQEMYHHEVSDKDDMLDTWMERAFSLLPAEVQEQFFEKLDSWLFHVNSLLQSSELIKGAKEQLIVSARAIHSDIAHVEDLRQLTIDQLNFLASQNGSRHRLYALAQGGFTGTGKAISLSSDFLGMLIINLRSVQLLSMSYGFDVRTPTDMMETLKVFRTATLPRRYQTCGWEDLMADLEREEDPYFYSGKDRITESFWMDEPLKQLLKLGAILMLKKNLISGIPILSMAVGAGCNYQTARKVTEFASRYYQYKYLRIKGADSIGSWQL